MLDPQFQRALQARGINLRPKPKGVQESDLTALLKARAKVPATQGATMRSGQAVLGNQLTQMRRADEASNVASGASPEAAVAQLGARNRFATDFMRSLVPAAERNSLLAISQALQSQQADRTEYWREREEKLRKREMVLGALSSALQAGANVMTAGMA